MTHATVKLTENELRMLLSCLDEGYADGDFNDWIDCVTDNPPGVDKRALINGIKKLEDSRAELRRRLLR